MRIEDRTAVEAAAVEAGKTREAQRSRQTAPGGREAAAHSGDRLQLSGLAGRIRQGLDAVAGAHARRVEAVANQVQSGRYTVDAARLSRAMLPEVPGT
jgi:flagellar biosynthesis anti-sigma factor FlgM